MALELPRQTQGIKGPHFSLPLFGECGEDVYMKIYLRSGCRIRKTQTQAWIRYATVLSCLWYSLSPEMLLIPFWLFIAVKQILQI